MRAVRFDGQFVRVVADAADPALAAGEALIHPTRVLATPADAEAVNPRLSNGWTGVVGSLFVGVVKRINPPDRAGPLTVARSSLLNKRVVGSTAIACTDCDMCRAGLPTHCRARRVLGRWAREGCWADLFSMPLANLVEVPPTMPDDRAVFAGLAASAVQASKMLHVAGRQYVSVIGDSALALLTAQTLAMQNPRTRLLYSRPENARLCERWGLKCRAIEEPGRRQDQDVVVECTATSAGLRKALAFVRPRGTIVLKSPAATAPFPPGQAVSSDLNGPWAGGVDLTPAIVNEIQILGCREAPIADGLGLLADLPVDVEALVTRRSKLDDAAAALTAAASGEHLAVLLDV